MAGEGETFYCLQHTSSKVKKLATNSCPGKDSSLLYILFSAELKPRGYYLDHVYYLDHGPSFHKYEPCILFGSIDFYNEPQVLFGLCLVLSEPCVDKIPNSRQGSVY